MKIPPKAILEVTLNEDALCWLRMWRTKEIPKDLASPDQNLQNISPRFKSKVRGITLIRSCAVICTFIRSISSVHIKWLISVINSLMGRRRVSLLGLGSSEPRTFRHRLIIRKRGRLSNLMLHWIILLPLVNVVTSWISVSAKILVCWHWGTPSEN